MRYRPSAAARAGFNFSALAFAVSAALPVTSATAEDIQELPTSQATAQSEETYKVEESTSFKYTQPLLETPKTITVIPESVLKDRNIDSLREALRTVPGISMAAGEGGTPTGDSMSIRGFDARNNIMIDGIRDIAGYYRDLYNVEAVEVAKGPGSAVYGRGSTGGSINLQTKTAKLDDFNDVGVSLGSESDYRARLDSNHAIGSTSALRINLLTDDGDVAGRDEVENSTNAVALSFATGLGTKSRFNINGEYQKQDNLPDYGIPWVSNGANIVDELKAYEGEAPPVDFSNFYGNVYRDFEDIEAKSLTAKYEYDLSDSTTLRTTARTGSVERQSIVTAPRFASLATSTDVRLSDEKTRDTKDSLNVLQFDLIGQYHTGGIKHDVVAGIEIAEEKFERWNYVPVTPDNLNDTPELVDLYNPNSNVPYTGHYARDGKSDEATGDTTGFYVFDTLTLNDQWLLSAGIRYDIFETEYYYNLDDADTTLPTNAKLEAKDEAVSWNLGAVYKPAPNGSIYVGVGTSFNPSAEDLTASTSVNSNQKDLDPEETISYELGTKWELFNGRLFTSAAIFRTEKKHALTDDPFGDRSAYDTLNGKQRVDGLELSAAGMVTTQLSITAEYTYQDSEVVNAEGDDEDFEGMELPRTPEHSFSVWGRYDLNDQWAFGLGAQYVGERYNSSDPEGRETAEDYLIYDMLVSYQINPQWNAQLNGSNLSDEEYIEQLGGGHFVPGEGRYFALSTNYSF